MATLAFNLNNYIRFRPSEIGVQIYAEHRHAIAARMTERGRALLGSTFDTLETDRDGWARMQAWEFMHIFGPQFVLGAPMPCDSEVLIEHVLAAIAPQDAEPPSSPERGR